MPNDPSSLTLPFGKYKGATVAELLVRDPDYAEWLLGQGWLAQRFAELHAAILSRGAGTDDSPEHNRIQACFLDPLFHTACLLACEVDRLFASRETTLQWARTHHLPEPKLLFQTSVSFEQAGTDVAIRWGWEHPNENYLIVEIKPAMGDDYPAVMRQMSRLKARCLVIEEYTGTTIDLPTLRKMFAANNQTLLTVQDVEAEIPNARVLLNTPAPEEIQEEDFWGT